MQTSPALSLDAQPKGDITGRKIAVLVNDGVDDAAIQSLQALAEGMRASAKIVGPRASSVTTAGGAALPVDFALSSVGSVLFDAVYVPDGKNPPADPDPNALLFIAESYKHYKAVGAGGSGALLVAEAARRVGIQGGFAGPGVVIGKAEDAKTHQAFLDAVGEHRWWQRPDALKIPV